MADVFIPTLHTFANNNVFTGSCGRLRFRIEPRVTLATPKEVDLAKSFMHCAFWHGELCFELSKIEEERDFPMSEDGRAEMKAWLESNA